MAGKALTAKGSMRRNLERTPGQEALAPDRRQSNEPEGVGDRVARFCLDRALILPVARLELGLHDAVIRSSTVGGFAALGRVVSLNSVVSAIQDGEPGSPS